MASNIASLVVSLQAETAGLRKDLNKATAMNKRYAKNTRNNFKRMTASSKAFTASVRNANLALTALGGVALTGMVAQIGRASDGMLNISNLLKASGVEAKNLGHSMKVVADLAVSTRSTMGGIGMLMARMTRSTEGMGYSMKEIQKATKTVTQGFKLTGATAQEATNSVIQLSQGLASGTLRGDELRSVLEQAPAIARLIAKELGISVGEIKKMAEQGKITTDVVMRALLNGSKDINDQFKLMRPTFDDSMTVLKTGLNAALGTVGDIVDENFKIKETMIEWGTYLVELWKSGELKRNIRNFTYNILIGFAKVKDFIDNTFESFGLETPGLDSLMKTLGILGAMKLFQKGGLKGKMGIAVTGLQTSIDKLTKLQTKANNLDGKKIKTGVAVTGVKPAIETLNTFSSKANGLDGKKIKATLDLDTHTNGQSDTRAPFAIIPRALEKIQGRIDAVKTATKSLGEMTKPTVKKITNIWSGASTAQIESLDKLEKKLGKQRIALNNVGNAVDKVGFQLDMMEENGKNSGKTYDNRRLAFDKLAASMVVARDKVAKTEGSIKSLNEQIKSGKQPMNKFAGRVYGIGQAMVSTKTKSGLLRGVLVNVGAEIAEVGRKLDSDFKRQSKVANTAMVVGKTSLVAGANMATKAFGGLKTASIKAGNAVVNQTSRMKNSFTNSNGTLSGQVAGMIGTSMVLSEAEKEGPIQNFKKAIEDIAVKAFGLVDIKLDEGSFVPNLISTVALAVGSFAAISAMAGVLQGLILAALSNPIVLAAATIALTAYLLTSEDELADQLRSLIAKTIEKVIYLPVELITGESLKENKKRNDNAILRDLEDDTLNSAMITNQRSTSLRELTIDETQKALNKFKEELNELNSGNALSRLFNSGAIREYEAAISRAKTRLGNNQFEINNPLRRANGGPVNGQGTATSDSIPAMLSNGEYVMKASAVKKFGPEFMSQINKGMMPIHRAEGGPVGSVQNRVVQAKGLSMDIRKANPVYSKLMNDIAETQLKINQMMKEGYSKNDHEIAVQQEKVTSILTQIEEMGIGGAGTAGMTPKDLEAKEAGRLNANAEKLGNSSAQSFKQFFAQGFSTAIKTGDFKGFALGLADKFTSTIIDNFASGFTDSLFGGGEAGSLLGSLGGLFSGQGKMGASAGGFDWGSAISSFGGLFMNDGGVVPHTPYSKLGQDSVPAMLTPGEVVVPVGESFGGGQTFHLNIQGDVSRQTRKQIVKMMPEITGGVNTTNRENNRKR